MRTGSSSQPNTHQPSPGRSSSHLERPWRLCGNQRTPANFQRAKDPVLCRAATAPLYQLESTITKSEAFRDLSLTVIQNPSGRRPPSTSNTRKHGALGCNPVALCPSGGAQEVGRGCWALFTKFWILSESTEDSLY